MHFTQTEAWQAFQKQLGRQTFRQSGDGWEYLAVLEEGNRNKRLYCPNGPYARDVQSFEEALNHIGLFSSKHSECIIAESLQTISRFQQLVDAACVYVNVSTAFTDGAQFGFGAEIGISTQKLHARGPMALNEITTYKYLIEGNGQIRS